MPGTFTHLHADAGETLLLRLPVPTGHGLQLGDVRQRGRQRLRGRHWHLPRHGLAGRLEHGAPGGIAKLHFRAFGGSIPGLVQQSAGTLDLYSMQIRASAFEGESGLTAQGNVGCDQLLCNDVNCTDVFTTGVDASGAVSCAALTATGTVAGATLSSTGPCQAACWQHSHHQQHGQRRELHHGGRRVHGHANGLRRSDGGKLRSHRCAYAPR